MDENIKYTVLLTVYKNDVVNWVKESFNSILKQTIKPNEFLILVDGPVEEELEKFLKKFEKEIDIAKIIYFNKNRGLGLTLRDGVNIAKNEYIARMDADDISVPERCEMQLKKFIENSNLDIVGGNIAEFFEDTNNIVDYRKVPEKDKEIKEFAKKRNPFNHSSVMFKKKSVIEAGNYQNMDLCEDYDLWARMIMNKCNCYNIQRNIVFMRTNTSFYKRRGGIRYLKSMLKLKKNFLKIGFYNKFDFLIGSFAHIINCLIPNFLRKLIYKRLLRKKI